jgi:hypothetical protein
MTGLLLVSASFFLGNQLAAQASISAPVSANAFQWRDQVAMQQIIQTEITLTNASLTQPNLTDWSKAMLEAYRSFLGYTQSNMSGAKDMSVVLDQAYAWIKSEPVPNVPARKMVLDDMKAKQNELILKLTFN